MSNGNIIISGWDKNAAKAARDLSAKRDNSTGGTLLGKRMVHRNAKAYNRRALRQADRRGE